MITREKALAAMKIKGARKGWRGDRLALDYLLQFAAESQQREAERLTASYRTADVGFRYLMVDAGFGPFLSGKKVIAEPKVDIFLPEILLPQIDGEKTFTTIDGIRFASFKTPNNGIWLHRQKLCQVLGYSDSHLSGLNPRGWLVAQLAKAGYSNKIRKVKPGNSAPIKSISHRDAMLVVPIIRKDKPQSQAA
jgi:hypothetical protein